MIRARRAAIFDLDGTIIPLSSERAFVRHLVRKGIVGPRDLLRWFRAGARTGSSSLLSSLRRCKLYLAGKPVEEIRRLGEEFVRSRLVNRIAPGAFAAAAEHRRAGDRIVLLSGSLEVLVEPMAKAFGAEVWEACRLEAQNGRLTGTVHGVHPLGAGKVQVAERLAEALGIDLSVSVAYADRFSDVPLLERVGEPVAVNPDRALRRYASQRGWRVLRWR